MLIGSPGEQRARKSALSGRGGGLVIMAGMGASERGYDRGTRQGERWVRLIADELRTARLSLGLSQSHVAKAARLSRPMYGRIERQYRNVPLIEIAQIGGMVGLELSAKMYPGGSSTQDAAHAKNLARVLRHVAAPLRVATDVPLPFRREYPERRAWDAILAGRGERARNPPLRPPGSDPADPSEATGRSTRTPCPRGDRNADQSAGASRRRGAAERSPTAAHGERPQGLARREPPADRMDPALESPEARLRGGAAQQGRRVGERNGSKGGTS